MRTTCLISLLLVMVLAGCRSVMRDAAVDDVVRNPHAMIFLDQAQQCPNYVRDINDQGAGNPAPRCEAAKRTGVARSDAICRHPGDTIAWRVARHPSESFTIAFKNGGVPAGWTCTTGHEIVNSCEIPYNETKGNTYKYSVTVDDCVLDPTIIIY